MARASLLLWTPLVFVVTAVGVEEVQDESCSAGVGQNAEKRTALLQRQPLPKVAMSELHVKKTDDAHPPDGSEDHCRPGYSMARRLRKDVNELEDGEMEKLTSAWRSLQADGRFDAWTVLHSSEESELAHGNSNFFPWHRKFMAHLETTLQKEGQDCSITLPFWNWAAEEADFFTSKVWAADHYGALKSGCVEDGMAAGWMYPFDSYDCVHREPEAEDALQDWRTIALQVQPNYPYKKIRKKLENWHGAFHCQVGGTMCDVELSPADPTFFLVHAFVDRLWWGWQRAVAMTESVEEASDCNGCDMATAYVGTFNVDENCVEIPLGLDETDEPVVCLEYQPVGGKYLDEVAAEMEDALALAEVDLDGKKRCKRLERQIESGWCSDEELQQIPCVKDDACTVNAERAAKLNDKWLASMNMKISDKEKEKAFGDSLEESVCTSYVEKPSKKEIEMCMGCDFSCKKGRIAKLLKKKGKKAL